MTYVIIAIATLLLFLILRHARRKGAYYNAIERELHRQGIDSARVDQKYGRGKYHATMSFMYKRGLSPKEAADAIAADLTGSYNEFLEQLNAEEWGQKTPAGSESVAPKQVAQMMENMNVAFELCALFSATLAEKPQPGDNDAQSANEFGTLMTSFVESLQAKMGIQIEPGSTGDRLRNATEKRDFDTLSELQQAIMNQIHTLSGEERSKYVFQLFWPQIYQGLNTAA